MSSASPSCKGHRYPVEVIAHCVWLCFRLPLSFREVEELMLERGVLLSHETVRRWCAKFGQIHANGLRRRRPRPGDKWHLDEVSVRINGELKYLWRAVDADDAVLDILVQNRRDKTAARRFFRRLLKTTRTVPRMSVTDKLRSYQAAHHEVMPSVEHRSHKGLNNRAENSHRPGNRPLPRPGTPPKTHAPNNVTAPPRRMPRHRVRPAVVRAGPGAAGRAHHRTRVGYWLGPARVPPLPRGPPW